ncbi:MAG: glucose-6-phosphate isomerase [Thaumarchaeota archaeon]|nr:glucose-6-phosphate isomerase [Nitrososphaerota archaeon]
MKNYDKVEFGGINQIIFTGMGGSGAIGDTLSAIVSKTNLHLSIVKGYHLPKTADSRTLVVATSVSGNTIETLTVLDNAKKMGCKLVAFSSGGKMEKYCTKNKIKYVHIPMLNSPRSSYPAYLYSILNVLENLIPIKKNDILESIMLLKKTQKQIQSSNIDDNSALVLAKWLSGIPMIYYPSGLQAAAIRFKNSLQENAKLHAIAEDVIEACHNGIVAWEKPSVVKPILLQGKDDYIKTKELWKVIKEYFVKNKIEYREVHSVNGNILSKIVNLVYLLDYVSIYRAVLSKMDPTPVKSIDFIKNKL